MAGLSSIVNLGYHGTSPAIADAITASGFTGSKVPTWAGTGKTFTSPNINVAQRYGPRQLGVVSSARNLTSPIGGGIGQGGISFGKEIVTQPGQATKGMSLYNKLMSGAYTSSPTAQRLLKTGTTAITNPTNWARILGVPLSALTGILSPTHLGAEDMPTGDAEQEYFDYYSKYGDIGEYANLKIPGWDERTDQTDSIRRFKQQQFMNRRKQDMQQRIRQGEAAEAAKQKATADAAAAKQASLQARVTAQANREARERVSRGEARDYGKTETRASSGWQSSPFNRGGLADLYRYGGFSG